MRLVLILQGKGTRNWTKAEQEIILNMDTNGNLKPHAKGVPGIEIQNMCSKSKYPHLACDVSNGQALIFAEHRAKGVGIHSVMGGTQSPTQGYYDEITIEISIKTLILI